MDIRQILETVDGVLSGIQKVTDAPGMNLVKLIPYVSTATSAISALRAAYAAGKKIEPFIVAITDTYGDGSVAPTPEKNDALNAKLAALEVESDKPLPPKEAGEED